MKVLDRVMWGVFGSVLDCLGVGAVLWVFGRYAGLNVGDAPAFLWGIAAVNGAVFVALFLGGCVAIAFSAEVPRESRK